MNTQSKFLRAVTGRVPDSCVARVVGGKPAHMQIEMAPEDGGGGRFFFHVFMYLLSHLY